MTRASSRDGTGHLTYCLNIHPGETWAENLEAIRTKACAVRDNLNPDGPFGLGLRLSARAAGELASPDTLRDFRRFLASRNLYVFTINGFPYGRFHGDRVKEHAYAPDWSRPERLEYTLVLARILARLLPEGCHGSISTVPGTYRPWATPRVRRDIIRNLMLAVRHFADLERRTGRRIVLALEPEPDCLWDRADHMVELFGETLPRDGYPVLEEAAVRGAGKESPATLVKRHLGVCLDTCHQAVLFEDPARELDNLLRHGITIGKVQISAAPVFPCSEAGLQAAETFVDSCYLHQTCIREPGQLRHRFPDLPQAIEAARHLPPASELRTHFHIPVGLDADQGPVSTRRDLSEAFRRLLGTLPDPHVEVETYTFDVLPEHLRSRGVVESICREMRWTATHLFPGPRDPRLSARRVVR